VSPPCLCRRKSTRRGVGFPSPSVRNGFNKQKRLAGTPVTLYAHHPCPTSVVSISRFEICGESVNTGCKYLKRVAGCSDYGVASICLYLSSDHSIVAEMLNYKRIMALLNAAGS
jgi:hypothetical protein